MFGCDDEAPGGGRDPKRIARVTGKLMQLWQSHPELRLGQLISNLTYKASMAGSNDPFYTEDDKMEAVIDDVLANGWRW